MNGNGSKNVSGKILQDLYLNSTFGNWKQNDPQEEIEI